MVARTNLFARLGAMLFT